MSEVFGWFADFGTIAGFTKFVAGFFMAYILGWFQCKRHGKPMKIEWHIVGIAIGVTAMIVVSIQSSEAYNTAKQTAIDSKNCQVEFHKALVDRSKIAAENDEISQTQRKIIFDWFLNLVFPPSPYDAMANDDPRRQDYGLNLTKNTIRDFKASIAHQNELQAMRDAHPLPDPTCGK